MIIGIGCDLIKIRRIKNTNISNLVNRILSEKEKDIFNNIKNEKRKYEYLSGRFAAKEAFSKALGTGIGEVKFKDIEVLNSKLGKPFINYNNFNTNLSITHTKEYALAFVVIEQ